MRRSVALLGAGVAMSLAITPLSAVASKPPHAPARAGLATVIADWQLNEGPGARVMTDSGENGLHGDITPSAGLETGFSVLGATGYHWVRRPPNRPPAVPERVVKVRDNDLLDVTDPSVTYTLELRYRTRERFGNVIQKGQSTTKGGQIKVQNPQGVPSCLFTGELGRVATGARTALNDDAWHVLRCVRSASRVQMFVDGALKSTKVGQTGVINNKVAYAFGGKINCDQIATTCDYFSGELDYVRITKG